MNRRDVIAITGVALLALSVIAGGVATGQPDEISIKHDHIKGATYSDGISQSIAVSVDKSISFTSEKYHLQLVDESTGGTLTVAPNSTLSLYSGQRLLLWPWNGDGSIDEQPSFSNSTDSVSAHYVSRSGTFGTNGLVDVTVRLLDSQTGEILSSTESQPHVVGYEEELRQNSSTGTIGLELGRGDLPKDLTFDLVLRNASWETDPVRDKTQVTLTYSEERDAFVTSFPAQHLSGGDYSWTARTDLPWGPAFAWYSRGPGTYINVVDPEGNSPPSATYSYAPKQAHKDELIEFNGLESSDFDGYIQSFDWDFDGDGDTDATGPVVSTSFPTSGEQSVTLTVTDDDGATHQVTKPITIVDSEPTIAFSEDFTDGLSGWAIDAPLDPGSRLEFGTGEWSSEYGGSAKLHVDGAPSGVSLYKEVGAIEKGTHLSLRYSSPNYAYAAAGLSLNLVTPDGENIRLDIDNDQYRGGFERDGVLTGVVPRDLPEGTHAEVKLVIWPGNTTVYVEDIRAIEPIQPPNAVFDWTPERPASGDVIQFNASDTTDSDGDIDEYAWDFDGDGETEATGLTPTYTFTESGSHTVQLTVSDAAGNEDVMERTVVVDPADTTIVDTYREQTGLWTYEGDAARLGSSEVVELTEPQSGQVGAIWLDRNVSAPFTAEFLYYAGTSDGADGLVMMFEKDQDYNPAAGGALGFVEPGTPVAGYGVQFDSYQNSDHTDPAAPHVALIEDSVGNHLSSVGESRVADGEWHLARVNVTQSSVRVKIDGDEVMEWTGNVSKSHNGFGFGAATGGLPNRHLVDDVVLTGADSGSLNTPNIMVESVSVPETATVNETVEVTATVRNSGSASGDTTVEFYADGEAFTTESVQVPAGEEVSVSAQTSFETTGTHTVQVNDGESKSITVEEAESGGAVYEPDSPAANYDDDDDGEIELGELGSAATAYAQGDLTISELGNVAEVYATS